MNEDFFEIIEKRLDKLSMIIGELVNISDLQEVDNTLNNSLKLSKHYKTSDLMKKFIPLLQCSDIQTQNQILKMKIEEIKNRSAIIEKFSDKVINVSNLYKTSDLNNIDSFTTKTKIVNEIETSTSILLQEALKEEKETYEILKLYNELNNSINQKFILIDYILNTLEKNAEINSDKINQILTKI